MGRQLPCFAFYGLQDIATMPESDGEIHFLEIDCLNGSIFRERQVKMADLILGWNIMIGYNETSAILIDRYTKC